MLQVHGDPAAAGWLEILVKSRRFGSADRQDACRFLDDIRRAGIAWRELLRFEIRNSSEAWR